VSARAIPVAARLSRQQLRFMADARIGCAFLRLPRHRKMAARLAPAFVTIEGKSARLTIEGQAVLDARRQAGKR
jgi:hypothetical protein